MELVPYNHPALTAVSCPVADIEAQVIPHLREMRQLMRDSHGSGLAAPQIGISLRFFVTNLEGIGTVINPELLHLGGSRISGQEGCLSKPGYRTFVLRYSEMRLRWTTARGITNDGVFTGYAARVLQHEIDHLNGVCIFQPYLDTPLPGKTP